MNLHAFFAVFVGLTVTAVSAAAPTPPAAVTNDGLVAVKSTNLDEVYLRPNADLTAYHKVIIDQPRVTFETGWLKNINSTRDPSRWLTPEYQQQLTDDMTAGLTRVMTDVFTRRGYEVVTTAGPGVLRVHPSVTELFLNAPDLKSTMQTAEFNRFTGVATLVLEARDAVGGDVLARVIDRSLARELMSGLRVGQLNYATDVSNLFWMDALFRQWATNCAIALSGSGQKVGFAVGAR